jgi:fructose-1-phosphate kinase PfkB-like protein
VRRCVAFGISDEDEIVGVFIVQIGLFSLRLTQTTYAPVCLAMNIELKEQIGAGDSDIAALLAPAVPSTGQSQSLSYSTAISPQRLHAAQL